MTNDTSAPGVSTVEDNSPAVSVNPGATAVPLFIAPFIAFDNNDVGEIIRISNWLDFTKKFDVSDTISAQVTMTSTPPEKSSPRKRANTLRLESEDEGDYTYDIDENIPFTLPTPSIALKLYFQNGGGACYVCALTVPEEGKDTTQLDALSDRIIEVADITLLACIDAEAANRDKIYGALLPLLDEGKGYFLVADSDDKGEKPAVLGATSHAAVYYPDLVVNDKVINESAITITGYEDGIESHDVTSLTDLRKYNSKLADKVVDQLTTTLPKRLTAPPSAAVVGAYCKTDRERGVWKAPANVVLNGVLDVSDRVSDDRQGGMNLTGINVIRYFNRQGVNIWGARTLLPDDDNWGSIPVRRLFDAAERDIKKALRIMIFEPNSQPTWKRVQAAIENYLRNLWQQGGLAGDKPEEAYYVRIGKDITMTQDDITHGRMIVDIGMAAVRPAEFIIVRFTQDMSQ